jgi:hypothetical protein
MVIFTESRPFFYDLMMDAMGLSERESMPF